MNKTTTESALTLKAKWVADLMKADGLDAANASPDVVLAYFDEVGRRIEKMQTTYLTRTGAREAMQQHVRSTFVGCTEPVRVDIPGTEWR